MSQQERKIYVGSLPESMTEQLLYTIFLTFGEIKSVELPREQAKHKGYGFVEFEDAEDCHHAIDNMHNAEVFGNIIKVQQARRATGPLDRAIWEDKEYQAKYFDAEVEHQDKEIDEHGEIIKKDDKGEKKEKVEKPLSQLQTLYALAKSQGFKAE